MTIIYVFVAGVIGLIVGAVGMFIYKDRVVKKAAAQAEALKAAAERVLKDGK